MPPVAMMPLSLLSAAQGRTELTEDQKTQIREAFALFDPDREGKLEYHALKVRGRSKREVPMPIAA